jgi:hypothetical protein
LQAASNALHEGQHVYWIGIAIRSVHHHTTAAPVLTSCRCRLRTFGPPTPPRYARCAA